MSSHDRKDGEVLDQAPSNNASANVDSTNVEPANAASIDVPCENVGSLDVAPAEDQAISLMPLPEVLIYPWDLRVRVVEYGPFVKAEGAGSKSAELQREVKRVMIFEVSRNILMEASDKFRAQVSPSSPWVDGNQNGIELEAKSAKALEFWMRLLHEELHKDNCDQEPKELFDIINEADYQMLDVELAREWFGRWMQKHKEQKTKLAQLLFPSYQLDNPEAFAFVTANLVVEGHGHLMEENPTSFSHLHLPPRVIRQMNAAKGSLRWQIHRPIMNKIHELTGKTCDCPADPLRGFLKGLKKTRIWDLQLNSGTSIRQLLQGLSKFEYTVPEGACYKCQDDFKGFINNVISRVTKNFDGLCLDCMDLSKPKTGDLDDDYWEHDLEQEWDRNCRIHHGQPTWYFSYMGRPDVQKRHNEKKVQKSKKRKR